MMSVVLVGPKLKDHIPCDGYNAGIKITLIRCHHIYLHCKMCITPRVLGLLLCHVRHYHCHEYNQAEAVPCHVSPSWAILGICHRTGNGNAVTWVPQFWHQLWCEYIILGAPQAPDRFNPKVSEQTCGIIQKLYETKHIETMTFGKSVMAHFSKIEPKTSK